VYLFLEVLRKPEVYIHSNSSLSSDFIFILLPVEEWVGWKAAVGI
jgi:hypothetical protein